MTQMLQVLPGRDVKGETALSMSEIVFTYSLNENRPDILQGREHCSLLPIDLGLLVTVTMERQSQNLL